MSAPNTVEPGPTSGYVINNVVRLRAEQRLTLAALSAKLAEVGRPILPTGLSRLERGERRIDVDDLTGLALALDVAPWQLLLPPEQTDPSRTHRDPRNVVGLGPPLADRHRPQLTEEAPVCGQCGCLIGDFDIHAKACFG